MKIQLAVFMTISIASRCALSNDMKCQELLPLLSDKTVEESLALFNYKRENQGLWRRDGSIEDVSFTLFPSQMTPYKISWKIKNNIDDKKAFSDGGLDCSIPASWHIVNNSALKIVYPKVAHGEKQDLVAHKIHTFAGIYLGKSQFPIHPDIARLMWHLSLKGIDENILSTILASFPFISKARLHVSNQRLQLNEEIQLVALNFSETFDIDIAEQRWLISDTEAFQAIRAGSFATEFSRHGTWLPWYDPNRIEFFANTPQESYETTVVAPLAQAKIFDRQRGQFIPDPIAVQDKMQAVYDLVGPLVEKCLDGRAQLFVHLVLKGNDGFVLAKFEIERDGAIVAKGTSMLTDPSLIGLPSAHELGFSAQADNDHSKMGARP